MEFRSIKRNYERTRFKISKEEQRFMQQAVHLLSPLPGAKPKPKPRQLYWKLLEAGGIQRGRKLLYVSALFLQSFLPILSWPLLETRLWVECTKGLIQVVCINSCNVCLVLLMNCEEFQAVFLGLWSLEESIKESFLSSFPTWLLHLHWRLCGLC